MNPKFTINLIEGSVSINFSVEAARNLQAQINQLMDKLRQPKPVADKTVRTKPAPQTPLEYQYIGDVFLEIFCNPNIWATPFAAKFQITLRDERIRLTT